MNGDTEKQVGDTMKRGHYERGHNETSWGHNETGVGTQCYRGHNERGHNVARPKFREHPEGSTVHKFQRCYDHKS